MNNCNTCGNSATDSKTLCQVEGNPGERFCRVWEAMVPEWGFCHLHPKNSPAESFPVVCNRVAPSGGESGHYNQSDESIGLNRRYDELVEAQQSGANNGAEIVQLTDECAEKGIVLGAK